MNNRHRQVDRLYVMKAKMLVKRLPSAVEMLANHLVYEAGLFKQLMDSYKQVSEIFQNYLNNHRKES